MSQITALGKQSTWSGKRNNMEQLATILDSNNVETIRQQLSQESKRVVLTGGCFDILHVGHITLLENAKKTGDVLFVMLESDEAIKEKKGMDRPIHTQKQRAHMLAAIRFVDYIIMLPSSMSNTDYDNLVKKVSPHIIAATSEDPNTFHKERQAKLIGAKVVFVNQLMKNISTTSILQQLTKEL